MENIEFYLNIPKNSMEPILQCISSNEGCRIKNRHSDGDDSLHIVITGDWDCYQKMLDLQKSGVAFYSIEHFEDDL